MFRQISCAIILIAGLGGPALAHSHKIKGLEIIHPSCLEVSDPAGKTVVVSANIKNRNKRADRLLSASSPLAEKVELQGPAGADGARPVQVFEVRPGTALLLGRDGPRILLSGLKKPLPAYDAFPMTLTFERAGKVAIEVMVEEAPSGQPEQKAGH
jgi:copper(I)-binding protein